tara:strand:- start:545 stop:742 length:198 start_codon:yes stop_codon:yes gene_type:complete
MKKRLICYITDTGDITDANGEFLGYLVETQKDPTRQSRYRELGDNQPVIEVKSAFFDKLSIEELL